MMLYTLTCKVGDDLPSQARFGANQRSWLSTFLRRGADGRCIGSLPLSHGPNVSCDRTGHCGLISRSGSGHILGEFGSRQGWTSVFSHHSVAAKRRGWHRIGGISEPACTCHIVLRWNAERHRHGSFRCLGVGFKRSFPDYFRTSRERGTWLGITSFSTAEGRWER